MEILDLVGRILLNSNSFISIIYLTIIITAAGHITREFRPKKLPLILLVNTTVAAIIFYGITAFYFLKN